jgi:hypothetical protein
MWNEPEKDDLDKIPGLYATEGTPLPDKLIHLHFFFGSSSWYVAEYDGADIFWGFAILNDDLFSAEWGYFPLSELRALIIPGIIRVDCDLFWQVRPAREVDKIRRCHPHWDAK